MIYDCIGFVLYLIIYKVPAVDIGARSSRIDFPGLVDSCIYFQDWWVAVFMLGQNGSRGML